MQLPPELDPAPAAFDTSVGPADEHGIGYAVGPQPQPGPGDGADDPPGLGNIEEREILLRICGCLAPKELGRLACISRGFGCKTEWLHSAVGGCTDGSQTRSLVEEAARRWVLACPAADQAWAAEGPRRQGSGWLRRMHAISGHQWDDETVDKQLVGYTCWCSGHHPTTRKAAKAALAEPRRTDFGSESGENSYDCRIRYLTHVANYKFPGEP